MNISGTGALSLLWQDLDAREEALRRIVASVLAERPPPRTPRRTATTTSA